YFASYGKPIPAGKPASPGVSRASARRRIGRKPYSKQHAEEPCLCDLHIWLDRYAERRDAGTGGHGKPLAHKARRSENDLSRCYCSNIISVLRLLSVAVFDSFARGRPSAYF